MVNGGKTEVQETGGSKTGGVTGKMTPGKAGKKRTGTEAKEKVGTVRQKRKFLQKTPEGS